MFDIGSYLEKFKNLSQSRNFLRDSVALAVKEACGFDIKTENIIVKSAVARINARPVIKTEIFLKKEKILKILKEKTGGKVVDIL
ncbi:MAG: hypothetical protein WCX27_00815 [Candidatus Paceibacterota bacterium]|jgi:hypothetical protein